MRRLILSAVCTLQLAIWTDVSSAAKPYTPTYADPVLEPWRWTTYPELIGRGARCMAEAKDGAMWFGLKDGCVRYDGIEWTDYTSEDGLAEGPVTALLGARDGSVYVGSHRGIDRFVDGVWERVLPGDQGVWFPVHHLMQASDGAIWASTGWGALGLLVERAVLFTSGDMAISLKSLGADIATVRVPDGGCPHNDWAGTAGYGVASFAEDTGSHRGRGIVGALAPAGPAARAGLLLGDHVVRRMISEEGRTLIVRRAGKTDTIGPIPSDDELGGGVSHFRATEAFEARDGAIWFGVMGSGTGHQIARMEVERALSGAPDAWRWFTDKDGLEINYSVHFAQADDGRIWVVSGHAGCGINVYMPDPARPGGHGTWSQFPWQPDTHTPLIQTSIRRASDGTLWIGGFGYLATIRNDSLKVYGMFRSFSGDMPWHRLRLQESSDGGMWVLGLGQHAARLSEAHHDALTLTGLSYQCRTPSGVEWFISRDRHAVAHQEGQWTRYATEGGMMDFDRSGLARLILTRRGELVATGSHEGVAAVARLNGSSWDVQTFPRFGAAVSGRQTYEDPQGILWLGAYDPRGQKDMVGGALRYDGRSWTHLVLPQRTATGFAYTPDGRFWVGGLGGLAWCQPEGSGMSPEGPWHTVDEPEGLRSGVGATLVTARGDLWLGTRTLGAFRYDGKTWHQYDQTDGLAGASIVRLLEDDRQTVWARTANGNSRFDGRSWITRPLPEGLDGTVVPEGDGVFWVNHRDLTGDTPRPSATRHVTDSQAPETAITLSTEEVSQPGNTTIAWGGTDRWNVTPQDRLQYAWRLGDGEWSAYSEKVSHSFERLPSGEHTFQVRARDLDLNVDPTPASLTFTVVPPVWQEPWFIALMAVMLGAVGFQTARVIRRDRRLREGNAALSAANKDLFGLNQNLEASNKQLDLERAVERVRAEITSMTSPDDLEDVIQEMLKEITTAGVDFNLCVVNIIDENAGTRTQYGATREVWAGEGTMPLSEVGDDFMALYRSGKPAIRTVDDQLSDRLEGTWDRVGTAAKLSRPTAVLDVPFAYGTLSLSTTSEEGFSEDDTATIGEFARVLSLGYSRFLDLQKLSEQTRQLSRDAAMQQVRAEVASMTGSDDIGKVISIVLREARDLGVHTTHAVIMVPDRQASVVREYCALPSDLTELPTPSEEPVLSPTVAGIVDGYDLYRGDRPVREDGDLAIEVMDSGIPRVGDAADSPEALKRAQDLAREQFGIHVPVEWLPRSSVNVPFSHGVLRFNGLEQGAFSEADLEIAKDFAQMVSLGYARFLDFQRLEAEGRERAKEAALERIRAEVASMTTSDDAGRVMAMVLKEIRSLGVNAMNALVMVPDEEMGLLRNYMACPQDLPGLPEPAEKPSLRPTVTDVIQGFDLYRGDRPLADADDWVLDRWRDGVPKLANSDTWVSQQPERALSAAQEQWDNPIPMEWLPRSNMAVPFSHGVLRFNGLEEGAFTEADLEIAQDFANMVSLGYARFLDFQRLEAEGRERAKEAALQRIRAEVASMSSSDDIGRIIAIALREARDLGVDTTCAIAVVIHEETETIEEYMALLSQSRFNDEGLGSISEISNWAPAVADIIDGYDLYRSDRPFLEGEQTLGYWRSGMPQFVDYEDTDAGKRQMQNWIENQYGIKIPVEWLARRAMIAPFSHGILCISSINPEALGDSELGISQDFAHMVSLGYARFLDFQTLEEQNRAMSDANKELYEVNRELQRERAVERIREKVQTMEEASDFVAVLSLLADDLKTAGLAFDTCGIEVVDEPVDEPSMSYFEEHGYRYTAYTIDPEGAVTSNPYTIPAPFPPVNLEAIQRFIDGRPWQAFTGGTNAILEVPAAGFGRLRLTASDRKEYSDEEVETLKDFAGAVALGYARFLDLKAVEEARQREMEELEKELQVAHDMQMSLLPDAPPEVEGIELSGICVPANHVGGDYFQYVPMEDGRLGIVVADVSGHAMQAATVAMRFNEMLRYELRGRTSPTEILEGLDQSLKGQIPETMFVTCGIGVWDPSDRSFAFASAANPEVYQFTREDGAIKTFGIQGIPLGLQLPAGVDAPFGSTKVTLDPGDLLVFTSDGVEEALDGSEAFYEAERLAALVEKLGQAGASADEMRDGITEDVRGFIGEAAQSDDITVVVVKAT